MVRNVVGCRGRWYRCVCRPARDLSGITIQRRGDRRIIQPDKLILVLPFHAASVWRGMRAGGAEGRPRGDQASAVA